jgi:[lysine-biosynthesis-protein LysW]--L-2-aminoadipate ligase
MTTSDGQHSIALLAERPRVEERLLQAAFAVRGQTAALVSPSVLRFPLSGDGASALPALALERAVATAERATLAALLAAGGSVVVNRAATTRLLADRLALLRHLLAADADIAVPETLVAFGPDATLNAISELGYPVILQTPLVDLGHPDAVVSDRDAAEALVEHRATLGDERVTLVQRYLPTPGYKARLVVAGGVVAAIERHHFAEGANYTPYPEAPEALWELGAAVVARLGSGVYQIEAIETPDGPVIINAGNLVDFRTLAATDLAAQIVEFALAELQRERERG